MSMSTHVLGFRPPDEKWLAMQAVWDACTAAGIEVPKSVDAFFGGMPPDKSGVEVEILCHGYHDDGRDGFEIDIRELPKDVTVLRFFNSW